MMACTSAIYMVLVHVSLFQSLTNLLFTIPVGITSIYLFTINPSLPTNLFSALAANGSPTSVASPPCEFPEVYNQACPVSNCRWLRAPKDMYLFCIHYTNTGFFNDTIFVSTQVFVRYYMKQEDTHHSDV